MATPDKTQQNFKSLLLKTPNDQKIELKVEQLERYYPDSKSLGRFGLKNAGDVIAFLNSPAGTTVKELIAEELAFIAAIENERRIEQQDAELRRRRLMAFLLLSLIASKEAKAKRQHIIVQKRIDKLLQKGSVDLQQPSTYDTARTDIINGYNAEINILNSELDTLKKEAVHIDELLLQIEVDFVELQQRHETYQQAIDNVEALIPDDFKHLLFHPRLEPAHQERRNRLVEHFIQHMARLAEQVEQHPDIVSKLIAQDQEEQARQEMLRLNQLHIEKDFLSDIIDGCRGEKHFYNIEGTQIFDPEAICYALSPKQKLVCHDGQILLLNQNDDVSQMGSESRAIAAENFKNQQNDIKHIPALLKDNAAQELTLHHQTKENLLQQRETNASHQHKLQTQIAALITARDSSLAQLKHPQLLCNIELKPSTSNKKSVEARTQIDIKQQLQFIRHIHTLNENPHLVQYQHWLALARKHPEISKIIYTELKGLPPTAPLHHTTVLSLLQNIERFGIDATKPAVTNIKNPIELREETKERKFEQTTYPTPFSTSLKLK